MIFMANDILRNISFQENYSSLIKLEIQSFQVSGVAQIRRKIDTVTNHYTIYWRIYVAPGAHLRTWINVYPSIDK